MRDKKRRTRTGDTEPHRDNNTAGSNGQGVLGLDGAFVGPFLEYDGMHYDDVAVKPQ